MLLEPKGSAKDEHLFLHRMYPLALDQFEKRGNRKKRMVDYDEEGNEIFDTIRIDQVVDDYEEPDGEDIEFNSIEDDDDQDNVVISDVFSEIDDYDVHPPPVVTEAKSKQEAEEEHPSIVPDGTHQKPVDIDGFSVDNVWESPQAVKRKKPVSKMAGKILDIS